MTIPVLSLVLLAALGWLGGCTSESQSSRSNTEIRRDSDRFFEKMKDEERKRPASTDRSTESGY